MPGLKLRVDGLDVRQVHLLDLAALLDGQRALGDGDLLDRGRVVEVLHDVIAVGFELRDVLNGNLEVAEIGGLELELAVTDDVCITRQERARLESDLVGESRSRGQCGQQDRRAHFGLHLSTLL